MRRGNWAMTAIVVLGVSLTLPLLAAGERDLEAAARFHQRGTISLQKGDFVEAEKMFLRSLDKLPTFPEAHLGLGHCAMRRGEFTKALAEYERARDGFGETAELLQRFRLKRYADAQRSMRELEDEINQLQNPTVKLSENTIRSREEQLRSAIRELRAIPHPGDEVDREPPGEVFFFLGNAQFRLEQLDAAEASWSTCVEKSPDFAPAYNNLAVCRWRLGKLDAAWSTLEEAERRGLSVNEQLKADIGHALDQARGGSGR